MEDLCKYIFNGTSNKELLKKIIKILVNSKWISTYNKNDLTQDDKNKFKNYFYYLINNDLYVISKNVTSKLIKIWSKILSKNYSFYEIYFKKYPIINDVDNTDIDYINKDMPLLQIRCKYPDYFLLNSSKFINYNNLENLENIQNLLLAGKQLNELYGVGGKSYININFWLFRGWTEDEAKQKISEIQIKNSLKFKNKREQNPELYKDIYMGRIEYWLKRGYSELDAKEKIRERQTTFTLEKCIQKYGEIEGKKRFEERLIKWLNTLLAKDNYIEIVEKRIKSEAFCSKISLDLFNNIKEKLNNLNINVKIYYLSLNHEWGFGIKKHGGVLYDFVIPELKYAIEFNGNRFHPNKEKLSKEEFKNWTNPWGVTAKEQYKHDIFKNNAIIKKGFTLDIIWEDDYRNNKENIINSIINKIIKLYNNEIY